MDTSTELFTPKCHWCSKHYNYEDAEEKRKHILVHHFYRAHHVFQGVPKDLFTGNLPPEVDAATTPIWAEAPSSDTVADIDNRLPLNQRLSFDASPTRDDAGGFRNVIDTPVIKAEKVDEENHQEACRLQEEESRRDQPDDPLVDDGLHEFQRGRSSSAESPSPKPDFDDGQRREAAKHKAEQSRVEGMKADLRAEYQRKLFEETMQTMRDPKGDLEASSERKKRMTAYFNETMEMLDKMDGIEC
ncbi:hypothetical protein BJ508DRAFT_321570 [Ascobolus immersus RN42]|uniref:Uncharacterized protein n=1 Tax=Ascobolus immersus RN42 TaxID=1160509 RepID=A0A3N4IJW3_ASCIM|nr:hypothetical protein BJ508DRAFT_321570 [Ascobolus immersus RN42]